MTYALRRDLLLALDVQVKVWAEGQGPEDAETGQPLRWRIEADPASLLDWSAPLTDRRPEGESSDLRSTIVVRPP
jgi:hypothetical protein